ncbi:ABC transporter substrate-binding protein [Aminobacter anthyllidis]|uniref:ABC transporter substrate-binding protein n=1 Tax=Aminobacter anthyllidis TaxID=1035067 RepID=A0A9X1AE06_9HYPH|nr:ABC transporter substrate-binding protein [Aminobacter anthyllidis]MBT1157841.1 ABC transporter substrate-binding protein [Aminobacter anthyllidis]
MKSLKRGSIRAALCLTVAAGALGLLSGQASAKTLVYCSEAAPEGFDPALYSTNSTWDASSKPIYSRLVEFENGTTNLVPGLAESWSVSDDMLTYTFKLRPGVRFQTTDYFTPTRDMNADDVVLSFDRQYRTDNPWHQYVTGANYEMYAGMDMQATVKDISKVDDLTVKLVLSQPNASILSNLAMDLGSIVSKEYADKLAAAGTPEKLNSEPVGTGPFQFVGYQQDAVVRFKANPTYWGAKPKLDELVFAITADASTRMQRLQAGECHVAAYPAPADVPGLKADPNLVVMEKPGLNVAYLAYNTLTPPFDKIEVRKALNMAIDKKAILQAVFQDLGEVAKNPIPPAMWGYNDAVVDDPYDPVAAKKMLDDAGVKDLKMKVWAMPVSRPYMPNARRVAELIQSDFQKVGVEVEVVSYEWAEYLKRARDKQRDGAIILGGTSDNGDPDNLLSYFFSCAGVGGANMANWCHQPFEDLMQKARTTVDQAERAKLYEQAQLIFKEQAPWATLDHSTVSLPMSKKVSGYVMDPLGSHRFETVDIAE